MKPHGFRNQSCDDLPYDSLSNRRQSFTSSVLSATSPHPSSMNQMNEPSNQLDIGRHDVVPLPNWMVSELGFDTTKTMSPSNIEHNDYDNGISVPPPTASQLSQMAQTIGEKCSEIESLRYELSRTRQHISDMERQRQLFLSKIADETFYPAGGRGASTSTSANTSPGINNFDSTDSLCYNESNPSSTWPSGASNICAKFDPSTLAAALPSSSGAIDLAAQSAASSSSPSTAPLVPTIPHFDKSIWSPFNNNNRTGNPFKPVDYDLDKSWIGIESKATDPPHMLKTQQPQLQNYHNTPSSTFPSDPINPPSPQVSAAAALEIGEIAKIYDKAEIFYPIKQYNESLNYRKLLERSVSCNWKCIVDRIVLDNDQQASIFLQQKLKIANPEQKNGIIDAIIEQSYMLMINRFGNFLVQRCLEYGTPEQITEITKGMVGNIIELAMDPFGCHVIQKALDCVSLEMKCCIIEEMLSRVTESVVHRYACHVWQKLFELRWETNPPSFMRQVNHSLSGMWSQVAMGETGSLVVQNIFENCTEQDKMPCVKEVVENLDTIIRGQWGNWVIQHMVEQANDPYRGIVCQQIIENSPLYSIDQFASKVVERMLKMGDPVIIQGFLDKVIEKIPERPRIPLIDIASDAHGNYLIQYILQSGSQAQKDQIASQLKKHMVSLRGSKWGSKCAWLIDRGNRSRKKL